MESEIQNPKSKIDHPHTILFVDDETSILKALQRMFRKSKYKVLIAASGQEGLEKIKQAEQPISLIVSDQRMPEMTGSQFLERAKEISPDSIRFLLTGYSDMDAVVDAINKGEIQRYFAKPWNDEDLKLQVDQAIKQFEMVKENKRLTALTQKQNRQLFEISKSLDKKVREAAKALIHKNKELETNLLNMVRAFGNLVEMHTPYLAGHGERVSQYAKQIAQHLKLSNKEINDIEIAGLLHDIGKLGFKTKLLEFEENKWSDQEKEMYYQHPEKGSTTVQFIEQLEDVANLILYHHEHLDGSGYPKNLNEENIPFGSKIIAVADAYDKIYHLKINADVHIKKFLKKEGFTKDELNDDQIRQQSAILHLKQHAFTWYDSDVVKAFLEILKHQGVTITHERKITIDEMKAGMVLTRHLYTQNKRFLLPFNTVLTDHYIEKLKLVHAQDEIIEIFCKPIEDPK